MIYSPTAQHALRALIFLARDNGAKPIRVTEIAAAEAIPKQFLSKILHSLRNKGLVKATKGPGGGYMLAKPSSEITVWNVVEAIDGLQNLENRCILGLRECTDTGSCALHYQWKRLREEFTRTIGSMTLEQASKENK